MRAIETGEPTEMFDIAIKTEDVNGKKFFFIGFDAMWVWQSVLSSAQPELQENIVAAIERYVQMVAQDDC